MDQGGILKEETPKFGETRARADIGEPKIAYYTTAGYAPSTNDPISIKKEITLDDSGKGVGNRLRVEVEVDYSYRKMDWSQVQDVDVYELVDDSLSIAPPEENYKKYLINFIKLKSMEEIAELKLELYHRSSLASYKDNICKKEVVSNNFTSFTYPMFYWDSTSGVSRSDRQNLSKYLKNNFNVKWADAEHLNISLLEPLSLNKKIIYINSTDSDDWIRLQIDDLEHDGNVIMTISDQRSYNLKANSTETGKISINDWNGIPCFHLGNLSSKDRLFYWYYVKPKRSGISHTETIIRINGYGWKGYPDIIFPMDILVDPTFRSKPMPIHEFFSYQLVVLFSVIQIYC